MASDAMIPKVTIPENAATTQRVFPKTVCGGVSPKPPNVNVDMAM